VKVGDDLNEIEELIDEHGKSIYNFCAYLSRNKNDAEDLFQDTFLKALEISSKIERHGNPKSYLLSIAVNLWKNAVKKKSRRAQLAPTVEIDGSELYEVADTNSITEEIVARKIANEELADIIDSLHDKHRIPIILFYSEGATISEISAIVKKPEGTVKRLLHEARSKIKKEMEEKGYGR
jgi:RNA polymerase sigma-70 factor (ECF subfamily)